MTGDQVEIPVLEGQISIDDVLEGGDDSDVYEAALQH